MLEVGDGPAVLTCCNEGHHARSGGGTCCSDMLLRGQHSVSGGETSCADMSKGGTAGWEWGMDLLSRYVIMRNIIPMSLVESFIESKVPHLRLFLVKSKMPLKRWVATEKVLTALLGNEV